MISLFAIAGLLIWILFKIRQLVKLNQSEEITALNATRIQSFSELYAKYKIVGQGVVALLAILAAYGVWNWLMWIGVYKGYKPEQPIYFSHKIHAGINKIDCQLCHSGAKYGKVSEIPSLNVCMNCHKAIPEYKGEYLEPGHDRDFYNGEIKNFMLQQVGIQLKWHTQKKLLLLNGQESTTCQILYTSTTLSTLLPENKQL